MPNIVNIESYKAVLIEKGVSGLRLHVHGMFASDRNAVRDTQFKMNVHLHAYLKAVAYVRGVHPHKVLEEIMLEHITKEERHSGIY